MNFIDNYGHIFSLPSHSIEPIGYEYEENPYIFWIDDKKDNKLSINNYYVKVINLLLSKEDITNIEITVKSKVFYLLNSKQINNLLSKNKRLDEYIVLQEKDFSQSLHSEDLVYIPVENDFYIVPLYIIGNSREEGSWYTNVLINIDNHEYTYITVGGVWIDECEALIINGKNMGVNLPKDIIKAVYEGSLYNEEFNTRLYNEKVKEYMMNYMKIKGETGNFNSVENSIKWFGWKDHISISKLLQTDNQFKTQFILDYFDLETDILQSFDTFRNSTYISLQVQLNKELEEENEIKFDEEFWGEGKPKFESLLDKQIKVNNDLNNSFEYIKSYYDYSFNELGLKLCALEYFLQKYFLPIHLSIHSATTNLNVFGNDIKFINKPNVSISESLLDLTDNGLKIEFPKNNILYFNKQIHYVDEFLNEFKIKNSEDVDLYYINDTCINIPIKFISNLNEAYYNCNLIVEKKVNNDKSLNILFDYNNVSKFNIKSDIKLYNNDRLIKEGISYAFSFDGKIYSSFYNDYNKLLKNILVTSKNYRSQEIIDGVQYNYPIEIKLYKSEGVFVNDKFKYSYYINVLDKEGNEQQIFFNNESQIIYFSLPQYGPSYYYVPSLIELENLNNFNFTTNNFINIEIYKIKDFFLKLKSSNEIINKISVDGNYLEYIKDFNVYGDVNYKKVYESKFSFIEDKRDNKLVYNNFILYPKIMGKNNEYDNNTGEMSYWLNEEFRLSLLVNNKWYFYNFTCKISQPDIRVGKLEYDYWDSELKIQSNFSQIKGFENIGDREIVKFNMFAHNPDTFIINNVNFYPDYIRYCILNNLQYIDKSYINDDDFYQLILLNGQSIRIHKSLYKQNFTFHSSHLDNANKKKIYVYLFSNEVTYLLSEFDDNTYIILEETNIDELYNTYDEISNFDIGGILLESDYDYNSFIIDDEMVVCTFDKNTNKYYVTIQMGGVVKYDFGCPDGIYPIEVLHFTSKNFEEKYIKKINLPINNKKYFNNIHIYNLYKNVPLTSQLHFMKSGDIINYKGIFFNFKNYVYENNLRKTKINLYGKVDNDLTYYENNYFNEESFLEMLTRSFDTKNTVIDTLKDYNILSAHFYRENDIINYEEGNLYPYSFIYYVDKDDENVITCNDIYRIMKIEGRNPSDFCTLDIFNIKNIEYNFIKEPDIKIERIKNGIIKRVNYQIINEENSIYVSNEQDAKDKFVYIDKVVVNGEVKYDIYDLAYDVKFYKKQLSEWVEITNISPDEYIKFYEKISGQSTEENKDYILRFFLKKYKYTKEYNNKKYYIGHVDKIDGNYYGYLKYDNLTNKYVTYTDFTIIKTPTGREVFFLNNDYIKIKLNKIYEIVYKENNEIIPTKYPGPMWLTESDLVNNESGELSFDFFNNAFSFEPYDYNNDIEKVRSRNELYSKFWFNNYYAYKLLDRINNPESNENEIKYELSYKYLINIENNIEAKIQPVVYIIDENNKEKYIYPEEYTDNEENKCGILKFNVLSSDKICYLFYQIININNGEVIDENSYIEFTLEKNEIVDDNYQLYRYELDDLDDDEAFDVKIDNTVYKYGQNISEEITNLYKDFFEYNTVNIFGKDYHIYSEHKDLNLNMFLEYDFYLMHDHEYWYCIYISKENISNIISNNDLDVPKDKRLFDFIPDNKKSKYKLEYVKSENKVLFNRMKFIDSNGVNHFNDEDLIVLKLENNDRLPVNIFNGTKWEINPITFGIPKDTNIDSNSEMCVLSLPINDNKYYKGYYNVSVRYSLDRFTQHQFKNDLTILIK